MYTIHNSFVAFYATPFAYPSAKPFAKPSAKSFGSPVAQHPKFPPDARNIRRQNFRKALRKPLWKHLWKALRKALRTLCERVANGFAMNNENDLSISIMFPA